MGCRRAAGPPIHPTRPWPPEESAIRSVTSPARPVGAEVHLESRFDVPPQNSKLRTGMPLGTDGGMSLRRLAGVARWSNKASRRNATKASARSRRCAQPAASKPPGQVAPSPGVERRPPAGVPGRASAPDRRLPPCPPSGTIARLSQADQWSRAMNRRRFIAATSCVVAAAGASAQGPSAEEAAVRKVVQHYVDARKG
jgi:hypothetical protein